MASWIPGNLIVFEKNEYYHNGEAILLDQIRFVLSDNPETILTNFQSGLYDMIDFVPNGEITHLKNEHSDEFFSTGVLGTYFLNFNVNDNTMFEGIVNDEETKAQVRKALGLLIDRNSICLNVGQAAGQEPSNSFVSIGFLESDGLTKFVEKNGPLGNGAGYYQVGEDDYEANCAEAIQILKDAGYAYDETSKKFTNFPAFEYLYNTGTGNEAIANYIRIQWATFGIIIIPVNQEWINFINTRKNGDCGVARNGWLSDFNDPISFLDMWVTTSGTNDVQYGREDHGTVAIYGPNHNQTWAQTYDVLIAQIKSTADPNTRFVLMHQAENMLMETGAICPIYFYTDLYKVSSELDGFFTSPLGYKFFMYCHSK